MRRPQWMQQSAHTVQAVRGTGLAAIVVALVWTSVGLSSPARAKPSLKVLAVRPVVVYGLHFRAHERVRVTAGTTSPETRTVRATARGSFTVRFSSLSVGRCETATVRAVGALGDRASSKVLRDEDCAPGLGP
jgi:hypothetical protein